MLGIAFGEHSQQHLRVRRNSGERCVHFVSYTCCEQPNGRKFFALLQLLFQAYSRCNIFEDNQSPGLTLPVLQWSKGNIENQGTIAELAGMKFVKITDLLQAPAIGATNLVKPVGKACGNR